MKLSKTPLTLGAWLLPAVVAATELPTCADGLERTPSSSAQGDAVQMADLCVTAAKPADESINQITIDQRQMERQLVGDMRDIVRHEPGVSVSGSGRYGNNGFAIRGVEKDRVAISVDGIPQGESFGNVIYKGYGYFNGTINDIETEHIKSVTISKGADSIFLGSGALGGAVEYRTKDPQDLIRTGNTGLLSRSTYRTQDRQKIQTLGLAGSSQLAEAMLLYTYRSGSELANFSKGRDVYGAARGIPDPVSQRQNNLLAKLNLTPVQEHELNFTLERARGELQVEEKSWDFLSSYRRFGDDRSDRTRYTLGHVWEPDHGPFAQVRTAMSKQAIDQVAFSLVTNEDYFTREFEVSEQKKRGLHQRSKQFRSEISTRPFQIGAVSNTLTFRPQVDLRHYENRNLDVLWVGRPRKPHASDESIIRPVRSRDLSFALVNESKALDDKLRVTAGGRVDRVRHRPSDAKMLINDDAPPPSRNYSATSLALLGGYHWDERTAVQYKVSQGYRIPKSEELYFDFGKSDAANRLEPNPDLKQERGLSQEIALSLGVSALSNRLNLFHTRYKDFIDLKQSGRWLPNPWYRDYRSGGRLMYQNHLQYSNVQSAKVRGVELSNEWMFSRHLDWSHEVSLSSSLSYAKGRDSDGNSLMAIQPVTWSPALTLEAPDQRYGARLSLTRVGRKAESEAIENGKPWRYLSRSYRFVDMTTYFNWSEQISTRVGVYNLFNSKYTTWDSLRSIPRYGTTNRVERNGEGLHRFTEPKRNFSVNLSMNF